MKNRTETGSRVSGVLAHPTSLPGPHGIGDLGAEAYRFVDFLVTARQGLWQVLPLGHTGHGYSPYAALSAFAGNPLLVSLARLADEGLLEPGEISPDWEINPGWVDFEQVTPFKASRLRLAYERFRDHATPGMRDDLAAFCEREASWLGDYALFIALKEAHGGAAWNTWDPALVRRDSGVIASARDRLSEAIARTQFAQYQFFRQWGDLKRYANGHGVRILGDIPIFVAYDSADVWARQDLFQLDERGEMTVVAGVPPDAFSVTGQRWGNPLYRWDYLKEGNYAWWVERFRKTLEAVDVVRLDHFRGFAAYWEVPAAEETAVNGRWVQGPGADLFVVAREALGELPIVIEDLGLITDDVIALREELGYPGMKVLHFAFAEDARNPYLPHNSAPNFVVYTGTHDNDTTRGWFGSLPDWHRHNVHAYLASDGHDITWDLMRLAAMSVADTAIFPLQDVLDLGGEARMNFPGRADGNWAWRVRADQLVAAAAERLAEMTVRYGRARIHPSP